MSEHAPEIFYMLKEAKERPMAARRTDEEDVAEIASGFRAHVAECVQVRLRIEDRLKVMAGDICWMKKCLLWGMGALGLVQLLGGHGFVKAVASHWGIVLP